MIDDGVTYCVLILSIHWFSSQANTEARGITLHKDSQFAQSWQNFKDNNPYVNKVLDWKTKLDESDNPLVRASMLMKDKVR